MLQDMRASCQLAADCLTAVGEVIRPGIATNDIDAFVHEYIVSRDAYPSPLDYKGFPKSVCTSVNDCVCHGIPGDQILKDGDIMNVDVTTYLPKEHGYHGDTSVTFYVGEPSEETIHVVETARRCLELGIAEVKHGNRTPRGRAARWSATMWATALAASSTWRRRFRTLAGAAKTNA
jgi:methionyl aminopeptidase